MAKYFDFGYSSVNINWKKKFNLHNTIRYHYRESTVPTKPLINLKIETLTTIYYSGHIFLSCTQYEVHDSVQI